MNIRFIDHPSKNFSDRPIKPTWIVIHCIGYEEKKALGLLSGDYPKYPVSAHYLVPQREMNRLNFLHRNTKERAYPIYALVDDNKRAWHAGKSHWGDLEGFNDFAIGIEFNIPNYANAIKDPEHINWYHSEKPLKDQVKAGITLIQQLIEKHNIDPKNIVTHTDIAPWRVDNNGNPILGKTDPGACFPMELLAKNGIGVWPQFKRTRSGELDLSVQHAQALLQQVGYNLPVTGEWDNATIYTIKAFKMHFMPEAYQNDAVDPTITEKMVIGLENLVDQVYRYQPGIDQTLGSVCCPCAVM